MPIKNSFTYPEKYSESFRWENVFTNSSLDAINEIQTLTGYKGRIE